MERKIGEIFTCDGKTYQVVKGDACDGCCILHDHCFSIKESLGPCVDVSRIDKTSIIFKEINNMEIKNNQLTIDIPEGMEIDLENSDLAKGIVRFKQSTITYEDVEDTLKLGKNCKSIIINESNASKLVALSRLMNIAKWMQEEFLKDLWHPVSEEPKKGRVFLYKTIFKGYGLNKIIDGNEWKYIIKYKKATQWLYIDDLLPKKGN